MFCDRSSVSGPLFPTSSKSALRFCLRFWRAISFWPSSVNKSSSKVVSILSIASGAICCVLSSILRALRSARGRGVLGGGHRIHSDLKDHSFFPLLLVPRPRVILKWAFILQVLYLAIFRALCGKDHPQIPMFFLEKRMPILENRCHL